MWSQVARETETQSGFLLIWGISPTDKVDLMICSPISLGLHRKSALLLDVSTYFNQQGALQT